jgi:hypothetical protein
MRGGYSCSISNSDIGTKPDNLNKLQTDYRGTVLIQSNVQFLPSTTMDIMDFQLWSAFIWQPPRLDQMRLSKDDKKYA